MKIVTEDGSRYPYQEHLIRKKVKDTGLEIADDRKFYIAGGTLRSVFSREPISDLDLYFPAQEDFKSFHDDVMIEPKKDDKGKDVEGETQLIIPKFTTDNALSYKVNRIRIQLIQFYFGEPADVFDKFDFTICMAMYEWHTRKFHFHDRFLEHLARRDIVFHHHTEYPICSMYRLKKFMEKGYRVRGVEFIKVGLAINNLHMEDYQDLRKQLEGIDTMFLTNVTDALMRTPEKKYEINDAIQLIDDTLDDMMNRGEAAEDVVVGEEDVGI